MENQIEVLNLIDQKNVLNAELNKLIYGSVEIRDKSDKKYIYHI